MVTTYGPRVSTKAGTGGATNRSHGGSLTTMSTRGRVVTAIRLLDDRAEAVERDGSEAARACTPGPPRRCNDIFMWLPETATAHNPVTRRWFLMDTENNCDHGDESSGAVYNPGTGNRRLFQF